MTAIGRILLQKSKNWDDKNRRKSLRDEKALLKGIATRSRKSVVV
jgi:hypothetical protein